MSKVIFTIVAVVILAIAVYSFLPGNSTSADIADNKVESPAPTTTDNLSSDKIPTTKEIPATIENKVEIDLSDKDQVVNSAEQNNEKAKINIRSGVPQFLTYRPVPGTIAPDFSLKTLDGRNFKLSDLRNKTGVILSFFFDACGYCNMEAPFLPELSAMAEEKGIAYFLVNQGDGDAQAKNFMTRHALSDISVLMDRDGAVSQLLGITGAPAKVVIDKKGIIRYHQAGMVTADKFPEVIKAALR